MSAVATLAADILDLTVRALATLPDAQRQAYQFTHGIDEHGETELGPLDNQAVADLLGVTRSTIRWNLAQAECNVFRAIARHLLDREMERVSEDEMLLMPGEIRAEVGSIGGVRIVGDHAHTGGTTLGARSERHVREAKRSAGKGRTEALIRAHRECVGALA